MSKLVWSELTVEAAEEKFELVADLLQDLGASGVLFDDPGILNARTLDADEILSRELLNSIPKAPSVKAYFPVDDRLGETVDAFKKEFRQRMGIEPRIELRQLDEDDWAHGWKAYYKPEKIGRVVVKPSWEEYTPQSEEVIIALDPGMAFGTGAHPTTRMCIRLLQELIDHPLEMLDVGTGSGILAITGAKLGAVNVVASDVDPVAVAVARENVALNNLSDQVQVVKGDLLTGHSSHKYGLVVANIIADIIIKLIPELKNVLQTTGRFMAAGIIENRLGEIEQSLSGHGFEIVQVVAEKEWRGIVAKLK